MDKITSCHVATFHAGLALWRCISAMAMGQNAKKSRPCKDLQKQIVPNAGLLVLTSTQKRKDCVPHQIMSGNKRNALSAQKNSLAFLKF